MDFLVLGPLEVRDQGVSVSLGSAKQRLLLASLLVKANQAVSIDWLADVLWGDELPADASGAIHTYVSRLRRLLEPSRAIGEASTIVLNRPPGYLLRVDDDQLDAAQFEALVANARRQMREHDPQAAVDALNEALGLWRGGVLAEFEDADFARGEVVRLEELRRVACDERFDAGLTLGQHDQLIGELEAFAAAEPLRERTRAQLMLALYRSGRQAEALRSYEEHRAYLSGELGVVPSASLQELERQIVQQSPELDWQAVGHHMPASGHWSDAISARQEHREASPGEDRRRGNIPRRPTSFIGRGSDVDVVARSVREGRLVTLTGVGGVGKTRLALEVADDLACDFEVGSWLCELSAAHDAEDVAQVLEATLRVASRAGSTPEDRVAEFLKDKEVLLVLDNCEHLVDVVGRFVTALVRDCPDVRFLVASRESLAIDGEQIWPVRPLPVPHGLLAVDALQAIESIRLFEMRARAASPAFLIDQDNAEAVAELCRQVDGIPLAIELAAARTTSMSPREIVEHLGGRFEVLARKSQSGEARHQTLWQTIDWSYSLLNSDERTLFERLSVYPGTFEASALSIVAGSEEPNGWAVRETLASLVTKSMVDASSVDGTTRFQMLETLRHFARDRLENSRDADKWRRRHAEFYASLAEEARPGLEGPDELPWRSRIHTELDNLRAAVGWALDEARDFSDRELAVRIVAALAYEAAADMSAGIGRWAARTSEWVEAYGSDRQAAVLAAAAWDAYAHGNFDKASELAESATQDDGGRSPVPMLPYAALSLLDVQSGRAQQAAERMLAATTVVDGAKACDRERADVRSFAAFCAVMADKPAEAATLIAEANELANRSGCPSARAHALAILGHVLEQEEPDRALIALEESIALTRQGASDFAASAALHKAAQLRARSGETTLAFVELRDSISQDHSRGSKPSLLYTLSIAVAVLADLGQVAASAVLAGVVTQGPMAPLISERLQTGGQARLDQSLQRCCDVLGDDEYQTCVDRGAAMPYDEVVAYAMQVLTQLASDETD